MKQLELDENAFDDYLESLQIKVKFLIKIIELSKALDEGNFEEFLNKLKK